MDSQPIVEVLDPAIEGGEVVLVAETVYVHLLGVFERPALADLVDQLADRLSGLV